MSWLTVIVVCGELGCWRMTAPAASEADCQLAIADALTVSDAVLSATGGGEVLVSGLCLYAAPDPAAPAPEPPSAELRGMPV